MRGKEQVFFVPTSLRGPVEKKNHEPFIEGSTMAKDLFLTNKKARGICGAT
jgi:hypothetical protein